MKFIGSTLCGLIGLSFFFFQGKLLRDYWAFRKVSCWLKWQKTKFMFLSLIKVTPIFLLSTQSLRLGIIFTKAFPADSIFRLSCVCHTAWCVSSLALINLLYMWGGNRRNGSCDVEYLKYHDVTNVFCWCCFPCNFVPIYFARSASNLMIVDSLPPLLETCLSTLSYLVTPNPQCFRLTISVCLF